MTIKSYLIVAMVLLATACVNSTAKNQQTEEKQPIPEGAVEMAYNNYLSLARGRICTQSHLFGLPESPRQTPKQNSDLLS